METVKCFPVNEVTEIYIKSNLSQVNVIAGNSKDIVLRWTDTKRRTTKPVLNGKKLSVKNHADIALYGVVGLIWLKQDKELTLEIPSEFDGSVQIESRDECVRILGVNCSCSLQVKTITGAIEISATDIQYYDLTSQSGTIALHGVVSEKGISVSTSASSIECFCAESAKSYLLDCHSEHGKCCLPAAIYRGSKIMHIHSRTGNINVGFADEKKGEN